MQREKLQHQLSVSVLRKKIKQHKLFLEKCGGNKENLQTKEFKTTVIMPLGDPPKKPEDDASDSEFEKYRAEIDQYVADKLKALKSAEEGLQKEKEESDARYEALVDREKELDDRQKVFSFKRIKSQYQGDYSRNW